MRPTLPNDAFLTCQGGVRSGDEVRTKATSPPPLYRVGGCGGGGGEQGEGEDPLKGIASADQFGPWAPRLDGAERLARLRSMRAIARLTLGPRGDALAETLRLAEKDPTQLEPALRRLDALAALDRRSVLCSFAALHRQS